MFYFISLCLFNTLGPDISIQTRRLPSVSGGPGGKVLFSMKRSYFKNGRNNIREEINMCANIYVHIEIDTYTHIKFPFSLIKGLLSTGVLLHLKIGYLIYP